MRTCPRPRPLRAALPPQRPQTGRGPLLTGGGPAAPVFFGSRGEPGRRSTACWGVHSPRSRAERAEMGRWFWSEERAGHTKHTRLSGALAPRQFLGWRPPSLRGPTPPGAHGHEAGAREAARLRRPRARRRRGGPAAPPPLSCPRMRGRARPAPGQLVWRWSGTSLPRGAPAHAGAVQPATRIARGAWPRSGGRARPGRHWRSAPARLEGRQQRGGRGPQPAAPACVHCIYHSARCAAPGRTLRPCAADAWGRTTQHSDQCPNATIP